MSDPKGKTIPNTMTMYLVILALYCIDIFFFQSDRSVLGDALYSRVAGLIVLFVYIWTTKSSLSLLGISKKKEKFKTGAIYGVIFSVLPLFAVIVLEGLFIGITDLSALDLKFSPPSLNFVRDVENLTPSAAVLIYIFTSFVGSVFKEFTFRGYILKKLKKVLSFRSANILQAVLYMFMTMPMLLRNYVMGYYDRTTSSVIVFIVFFYIIHETIAGIKWGLLTRVTGTTYVAIVDHFLFVFLANSIYITDRYVTWSFMAHMLAVQVISFILVLLYYKKNIKKIDEKSGEKSKDKKETESKIKEKEKKEKVDEKLNEIDEISPEQYKSIVDETDDNQSSHHHHHHSSEYEHRRNESYTSESAGMHHESSHGTSHHHHHHHSSDPHSHSHSAESGNEVSFEDNDIDAFLKNFNEENSGSHHHHHHHHSQEEPFDESMDITEGFDADRYLKDYQRHNESRHSSSHSSNHHSTSHSDSYHHSSEHHHSSHHSDSDSPSHHHHTHEHSDYPKNKPVSTDTEYDKVVSDININDEENKGKKSFFERIRDLGKLDDTDSNDLI